MAIRRRVYCGLEPPRGYGVAWVDFTTREAICYPVPINWFVWLGHNVMKILRVPPWSRQMAKEVKYWYGRTAKAHAMLYEAECKFLDAENLLYDLPHQHPS